MPQYYSDQNNVLGTRPIARPVEARRPNWLLATLLVVLVMGLSGWLLARTVGTGGGSLGGSVAYVVVQFDDRQISTGSGWVCAPGEVLTTLGTAFPRGVADPPAKVTVFVETDRPQPRELTMQVSARGTFSPQDAVPRRLSQDWARLRPRDAGAELRPLPAASALPAAGAAVTVHGYDPDSGSLGLLSREAVVKAGPGGLVTLEPQPPRGFDGGPVTASGGQVVAMWNQSTTALMPLPGAASGGQ
ncbi:MAG: hypothetical protein IT204_09200 [Fimbriimonadaceae bacterium]|nr:hypothetical protein [Fimbriimonadaceae bacterium]